MVKNVESLINLANIEITGGFISSTIQDVLVTDDNGELIPARGLAKVLGRIAALRISHGNITQIMTRNLQHKTGLDCEYARLGGLTQIERGGQGGIELVAGESQSIQWTRYSGGGRAGREQTGDFRGENRERGSNSGSFSY